MPVIVTEHPAETRSFYEDVLGFAVAMEQDGLLMLKSPSTPTTQLIVVWASPTASDPHAHELDVSIEVDDVNAAHAEAVVRGLDIVYGLTDEPWGIRRFFVREPSGRTINVASHIDEL
jgi:catechol 2,3-dioxygenase-like lactoylglutathione lyase family enzyme